MLIKKKGLLPPAFVALLYARPPGAISNSIFWRVRVEKCSLIYIYIYYGFAFEASSTPITLRPLPPPPSRQPLHNTILFGA